MFQKLKELDSTIKGPYICGDDITIADCAAFPFINFLSLRGMGKDGKFNRLLREEGKEWRRRRRRHY